MSLSRAALRMALWTGLCAGMGVAGLAPAWWRFHTASVDPVWVWLARLATVALSLGAPLMVGRWLGRRVTDPGTAIRRGAMTGALTMTLAAAVGLGLGLGGWAQEDLVARVVSASSSAPEVILLESMTRVIWTSVAVTLTCPLLGGLLGGLAARAALGRDEVQGAPTVCSSSMEVALWWCWFLPLGGLIASAYVGGPLLTVVGGHLVAGRVSGFAATSAAAAFDTLMWVQVVMLWFASWALGTAVGRLRWSLWRQSLRLGLPLVACWITVASDALVVVDGSVLASRLLIVRGDALLLRVLVALSPLAYAWGVQRAERAPGSVDPRSTAWQRLWDASGLFAVGSSWLCALLYVVTQLATEFSSAMAVDLAGAIPFAPAPLLVFWPAAWLGPVLLVTGFVLCGTLMGAGAMVRVATARDMTDG